MGGDECGGLFGLYGTCADDLECVDNSLTQRTCQVCASAHWTGAVTGRSGKGMDWPMWWTRRRELGSAWRDVCTGRKGCPAALNTVLQQGKVIVLSVVGISYVYSCNIYNLRYSYEKLHSS